MVIDWLLNSLYAEIFQFQGSAKKYFTYVSMYLLKAYPVILEKNNNIDGFLITSINFSLF